MKLRLWSDIHLEFGDLPFTPREDDKDTVLVIAGDFQKGLNNQYFLEQMIEAFKAVVYVPGNHEYYENTIEWLDEEFYTLAEKHPTFHFLQPGVVVIDDVRFIGGTLWTDFNGNDDVTKLACSWRMNDYNFIKRNVNGYQNMEIDPSFIQEINARHRRFFEAQLQIPFDGKTIVVSHHAPLLMCGEGFFHRGYRNEHLTEYAYCNTGLENWFADYDFHYWLHGHIHKWQTHDVCGKQIIARPRGYHNYQPMAGEYDKEHRDACVLEI